MLKGTLTATLQIQRIIHFTAYYAEKESKLASNASRWSTHIHSGIHQPVFLICFSEVPSKQRIGRCLDLDFPFKTKKKKIKLMQHLNMHHFVNDLNEAI